MVIDPTFMALMCGHIVGDFVLQPDEMIVQKMKRSRWILIHSFIIAFITLILLGDPDAVWLAGSVGFLHFLIDLLNKWFQNFSRNRQNTGYRPNELNLLFLDQCLHICVLILVWEGLRYWGHPAIIRNLWFDLLGRRFIQALIFVSGFAVTVWGIAVVLKIQMAELALDLGTDMQDGIPRGGRTIGMLERLLAFAMILAGHPGSVGFIVAAKSVFRIGDLTKTEDRRKAEYIFIGTFRSFAYAVIVSLATVLLLKQVR